jgi:hypothetical protein
MVERPQPRPGPDGSSSRRSRAVAGPYLRALPRVRNRAALRAVASGATATLAVKGVMGVSAAAGGQQALGPPALGMHTWRCDPKSDAVITIPVAREDARRVVIDVGIGKGLGPLEHSGVVDRPKLGVTSRSARPLAAAAVLLCPEASARRNATDDPAPGADLEHGRANHGFGATGWRTPVEADPVPAAAPELVDVHGQVRAVDHAHVVEIKMVPSVEVVLRKRRRYSAKAGALEPAVAVPGLAPAGARGVEVAPRPAPEATVPMVGDGNSERLAGEKGPTGRVQLGRCVARRGCNPNRLLHAVDERYLARSFADDGRPLSCHTWNRGRDRDCNARHEQEDSADQQCAPRSPAKTKTRHRAAEHSLVDNPGLLRRGQ